MSGLVGCGLDLREQVPVLLAVRDKPGADDLLHERRCSHCHEPLGDHPFDLHPRCYFHAHLAWSEPGPNQPRGVA